MKTAVLYLLVLGFPLRADFKAGLAAFDRGDFKAAMREWLPVAEQGDANAQFNVGLLYASGKGVPQDHKKAAEWYRKAAEQGVGAAKYNLGVMYANGDGVARDVHAAVKWLQRAADAGIPLGREHLADLYGSAGNYAKSLEWHQREAEKGDPVAQFDLGLMYDLGRGVTRDYAEAMKWYRKSADQGYAPAMTNIAILYYNQEGVKRSLVDAYAWFVRAKLAHDPRADDLLQMTMDKMKGEQIREGETLAANWHPQKPAAAPPVDLAVLDNRLFKQPGPAAAIQAALPPPAQSTSNRGEAARESLQAPAVTGAQKVVAVGDGVGNTEPFLRTLQSAALVDSDGKWIGGKTHLVITSDRVEGAFSDTLNRLQAQAAAAGGGVHVLVGPGAAVKINDTLFLHDASYKSAAEVEAALRQYGVWRVVVGHGGGDAGILPRYRGRLIVNDDPQRQGCLVIEYGKAYALYRGRGLSLPSDEGADLQRYQRQVAELAAR